MEKEMLGLYVTGHPLEEIREEIAKQSNINTMQIRNAGEVSEEGHAEYKDGQTVKFAGIINSVKKKYTKTNKLMAFLNVEDLYGSCEIIIFENCYQSCSNILVEDNVVLVEGRLSIREDEETKVVASSIKEFGVVKNKCLNINITNLDDKGKDKLRGALKFFTGEKNNIQVYIINGDRKDPAGGIFINEEIIKELQEIVGKEKVIIE